MFKLQDLISLSYQDFGKLLDSSGDRLYRKLMMALGVDSDKELAQKLGISEQAVNNAKRTGKIPDRWLMYAVCTSGFALPLLVAISEEELGKALAERDKYAYKLVPIVTSLQYPENETYAEHVDSYLAIQNSAAMKADAKDDELVAAVVQGHALEPSISQGDMIVVSLSQLRFAQDGVFVINLDGTRLLCRLNKLPGKYRVTFDNPKVADFEVEEVNIYGRVLWVFRGM